MAEFITIATVSVILFIFLSDKSWQDFQWSKIIALKLHVLKINPFIAPVKIYSNKIWIMDEYG